MLIFPDHLKPLIEAVVAQLRVDSMGEHGMPHWLKVYRNGLLIAKSDPRVDLSVLEIFAIVHDSQHESDDGEHDMLHGIRAGQFCFDLSQRGLIKLDKERLTMLRAACCDHVLTRRISQHHHSLVTIAACWDADRLEAPRFGHTLTPELLYSPYALTPGVIERHVEEAWNPDDPAAMIEVS